jgi:uncharacterized membrane protein YfcA
MRQLIAWPKVTCAQMRAMTARSDWVQTEPFLAARARPIVAFAFAAPIAVLGGLIGLGGAEFRLPVLVGPLGHAARRAVPLNLAVSLVTIAASLITRGATLSLATVMPFGSELVALISGGVVAAFVGAGWASRFSEARLRQVILVLLVVIGVALISEGFLPSAVPALLPDLAPVRIVAGVLFGLAIGVAGGEVIIPTLVFAFGADIKTAGTASLLVSLPTVLSGIVRYARRGAYADRGSLRSTVAPMAVGSVIGAVVGGLLSGVFPAAALKLGLGLVLIWSAQRIFRGAH